MSKIVSFDNIHVSLLGQCDRGIKIMHGEADVRWVYWTIAIAYIWHWSYRPPIGENCIDRHFSNLLAAVSWWSWNNLTLVPLPFPRCGDTSHLSNATMPWWLSAFSSVEHWNPINKNKNKNKKSASNIKGTKIKSKHIILVNIVVCGRFLPMCRKIWQSCCRLNWVSCIDDQIWRCYQLNKIAVVMQMKLCPLNCSNFGRYYCAQSPGGQWSCIGTTQNMVGLLCQNAIHL